MKRRNFVFLLFLLSISLILFKGLAASENTEELARTDMILLKSTEIFEKHERPDVVFLHDRHTKIVASMNEDCSFCHLKLEDGLFEDSLSPKFKRLEDKNKQELVELYHNNCVGCHEKTSSPERSGPELCEGCHKKDPIFSDVKQSAGFDKSLHHRHLELYKDGDSCETCHHESGSCRYCHKDKETEDYPLSMERASHASCLGCHIKEKNEEKASGPTNCYGCHDLKEQEAALKLDVVPRLKLEDRQPDMRLIKVSDDLEPSVNTMMGFVPFNHKSHEKIADSCLDCHHKEIASCSSCHSLEGKEEGAFISFKKAMHKVDSKSSCVGCHNEKQRKQECAGCHSFAEMSRKKSEDSCLACHLNSSEELNILKNNSSAVAAEKLLKLRTPAEVRLENMKIPETIVIDGLSEKYGPATFPHLKVIKSIASKIQDNGLAGFFHREKETICQGCHHNSPKSESPPRCVSCHYKSYSPDKPLHPAIMGAYHIQCAGCHERMKIGEFTECEDCHQSVEAR